MSDLNRQLIEQLLQRIDLLEKTIKKSKKSKKAKKDYDGDGEIESGTEEYMGSRDKAIKKAMGKKIEEALDRVGGNVNFNSPSIRSLASKIEKSDMVDKVLNKLNEGTDMNRKSFRDQGTKIQLSENIVFGGFPRVLKEAEYKIPAKASERTESPAEVGMDEFEKLMQSGSHPIMAGQSNKTGRGVPQEIRAKALEHIKILKSHPKGAIQGYGKEHPVFKQGMEAHEFFKKHFPEFGVEEQIASDYNLFA